MNNEMIINLYNAIADSDKIRDAIDDLIKAIPTPAYTDDVHTAVVRLIEAKIFM